MAGLPGWLKSQTHSADSLQLPAADPRRGCAVPRHPPINELNCDSASLAAFVDLSPCGGPATRAIAESMTPAPTNHRGINRVMGLPR